jgi:hypothetical protein
MTPNVEVNPSGLIIPWLCTRSLAEKPAGIPGILNQMPCYFFLAASDMLEKFFGRLILFVSPAFDNPSFQEWGHEV